MNDNQIIGSMFLIALIAVGGGFILCCHEQNNPSEEDRVIYQVSKYWNLPAEDGSMAIYVQFSDDPVDFQLYYKDIQLTDFSRPNGNYDVSDSFTATPTFMMPDGVDTYDQLIRHLVVRSQHVDLVQDTPGI